MEIKENPIRILLIDDDDDNNFLNKIIIEESEISAVVYSSTSVTEALNFLRSGGDPHLIFLDINMPTLDGWDFINEYRNLSNEHRNKVIIMLTSSINESDEKRARTIKEISDFKIKPLTQPILEEIIFNYF